jgi:hypothetical protein
MALKPEVESCGAMNENASQIEQTILAEPQSPAAASESAIADRLLDIFPWLGTDEEEQISGADTIDELQELYDSLRANAAAANKPAKGL